MQSAAGWTGGIGDAGDSLSTFASSLVDLQFVELDAATARDASLAAARSRDAQRLAGVARCRAEARARRERHLRSELTEARNQARRDARGEAELERQRSERRAAVAAARRVLRAWRALTLRERERRHAILQQQAPAAVIQRAYRRRQRALAWARIRRALGPIKQVLRPLQRAAARGRAAAAARARHAAAALQRTFLAQARPSRERSSCLLAIGAARAYRAHVVACQGFLRAYWAVGRARLRALYIGWSRAEKRIDAARRAQCLERLRLVRCFDMARLNRVIYDMERAHWSPYGKQLTKPAKKPKGHSGRAPQHGSAQPVTAAPPQFGAPLAMSLAARYQQWAGEQALQQEADFTVKRGLKYKTTPKIIKQALLRRALAEARKRFKADQWPDPSRHISDARARRISTQARLGTDAHLHAYPAMSLYTVVTPAILEQLAVLGELITACMLSDTSGSDKLSLGALRELFLVHCAPHHAQEELQRDFSSLCHQVYDSDGCDSAAAVEYTPLLLELERRVHKLIGASRQQRDSWPINAPLAEAATPRLRANADVCPSSQTTEQRQTVVRGGLLCDEGAP